jgi:hypothetical protein
MMQATQSRHGNDLALPSGIRFRLAACWRFLRQTEVKVSGSEPSPIFMRGCEPKDHG